MVLGNFKVFKNDGQYIVIVKITDLQSKLLGLESHSALIIHGTLGRIIDPPGP